MTAKEKHNLIRITEELQELNHSIKSLKQQSAFDISSIISNDDLIKRMHICRKTAFNWRKSGALNFIKVGRKIYYKSSDVARLLDNPSMAHYSPSVINV